LRRAAPTLHFSRRLAGDLLVRHRTSRSDVLRPPLDLVQHVEVVEDVAGRAFLRQAIEKRLDLLFGRDADRAGVASWYEPKPSTVSRVRKATVAFTYRSSGPRRRD
jgi:hypothetical protein